MKEEKEGSWLRVRTFIFQVIVVICLFIVVGLLPPPINILGAVIIVAIMLNWNKLFNKKERERK